MAWNSARPPGEGVVSGGSAEMYGALSDSNLNLESVVYKTWSNVEAGDWKEVDRPGWVNIVAEHTTGNTFGGGATLGFEVQGSDKTDGTGVAVYCGSGRVDASAEGKTHSLRVFVTHKYIRIRTHQFLDEPKLLGGWERVADGATAPGDEKIRFNAAKTSVRFDDALSDDGGIDYDDAAAVVTALAALSPGDYLDIVNDVSFVVSGTPTNHTTNVEVPVIQVGGAATDIPAVSSTLYVTTRPKIENVEHVFTVYMRSAASDAQYFVEA